MMWQTEGFIVKICNRRATDGKGRFVLFVQVILACSYYSKGGIQDRGRVYRRVLLGERPCRGLRGSCSCLRRKCICLVMTFLCFLLICGEKNDGRVGLSTIKDLIEDTIVSTQPALMVHLKACTAGTGTVKLSSCDIHALNTGVLLRAET